MMAAGRRGSQLTGRGALLIGLLTMAALPVLTGCGGKGGKQKDSSGPLTIQNCGSDTMVNLAQMWAEEYRKVAPGVSVEVSGGGSGVGVRDLTQGIIDIANCSRAMKESEKKQAKSNTNKDPIEFVVGYDAMAIYVHKDNPLDEISIEQLAAIYGEGGEVENWSQIGVKLEGAPDEIVRVSRQNSSGTYFFFREHVLSKKDFKRGSRDMSGSKDVVELVGKTMGAIGYSGMGYKTDAVKFVKIIKKKGDKAWAPTLANVTAGHYSLARPLRMYTLGQPEGHVKKYIDWVLGAGGQDIVKNSGYIPIESAEGDAQK